MIQTLITYWMIGLAPSVDQFFVYFLVLYLLCFNGMSMGLFLGSSITDAKSLAYINPLVAQLISLFAGFYKNFNSIPEWISWIQYIVPTRYSFQAFTQNEVGDEPSLIDQLNFGLDLWTVIGLLVALGFVYRLLSLFFLWLLRTKMEWYYLLYIVNICIIVLSWKLLLFY